MPTEDDQSVNLYFETPERSERLQLISHLLNNAEEVPYLRGPAGSGKTRFAAHLVEKAGQDYEVVWLNGARAVSLRQELADELGLDSEAVNWPGDLIAAAGDRLLLVIIDDADQLDLAIAGDLFDLHAAGGRLLFLGVGALSQLQGSWDFQFVDLPPFSEQQSQEFLNRFGRDAGVVVSESVALGLQRAAEGLPGHLLNALSALPAGKIGDDQAAAAKPKGLSLQMLLLGGGALLLLVLVLVFQGPINRLFEPAPVVEPPPQVGLAAENSSLPAPVEPEARPEPEPEPEVRQAVQAIDRSPVSQPEAVRESPSPVAQEESPVVQEVAPEPVIVAGQAQDSGVETVVADSESGEANQEEESDPLLDAVIDAAIAAAEQPPQAPVQQLPQELPAQEKPEEVPVPAVAVTSETPPASDPQPVAEKAEASRQAPAPAAVQEAKGADWIRAQRPEGYTLQLVGARDPEAIRKFIDRHGISQPFAVFQRDLNGQPWYSLVAGVYKNRDQAVAARSRLRAPLNRSGVWPRTFASIVEQLKN